MDYLPIFVGVTAAAVVIQAGILVALYVAVRKSTSRMEALATQVSDKVMPTVDTAQSMLVEWRPKFDNIAWCYYYGIVVRFCCAGRRVRPEFNFTRRRHNL